MWMKLIENYTTLFNNGHSVFLFLHLNVEVLKGKFE
jgi:hypothetical protein